MQILLSVLPEFPREHRYIHSFCLTSFTYASFAKDPIGVQLFTNAAAALPCEMDGKPETSQKNPLQMLVPSKAASALRARIARNRRQVLLE